MPPWNSIPLGLSDDHLIPVKSSKILLFNFIKETWIHLNKEMRQVDYFKRSYFFSVNKILGTQKII